jgi:hypothetical protein
MRRCAAIGLALALSASVIGPIAGTDAAHATSATRPASTQSYLRYVTGPTALAARVGFSQGSSLLWESDADQVADLDGMAHAGAKWVSADFDWPSAEQVKGQFWWGAIDRVVNNARARGLNVMGAIVYTPTWARPAGTTDKTPPTDPNDIAAFARAAVQRYAPLGVHAYQIWNEPNVKMFWESGPDPAYYTRLLEVAYRAIKSVDPFATVIAGGLAPAADAPGSTISPFRFLADMYTAGAAGSFDALGLHPYSFPYAPTTPGSWNPFQLLPYYHVLMTLHGDGTKKIWATEVGFGTGSDGSSVSESLQATRLREVVQQWVRWPFTAQLFLYDFRDLDATSSSVFDHMGVLREDGSAKPAYSAVHAMLVQRRTVIDPRALCRLLVWLRFRRTC